MKTFAAVFGSGLIALASVWAFAHDAGHGPLISGKGPSGGNLSAIIHAKDAEKGAKAAVQGIAEWKVRESANSKMAMEVVVRFYRSDRKTEVEAPAQIKWIQIGKALAKPIVTAVDVKTTKEVVQEFPLMDFAKTGTIEMILTGFDQSKDKHVTAYSVGQ